MLETDGLGVRRGRQIVVEGFSVTATQGIVALAGPNGAGKTSVIRVLATLDRPAAGTAFIAGQPLMTRQGRQRARRVIGYLAQEARFPTHFTARETVEYGAWLNEIPSQQRRSASLKALDLFNAGYLASRRLSRMSTGEKQRVLLAQATVHAPRLLLLDEPTAALDPEQRTLIRRLLREWSSTRLVIVATHLIEELEMLSDRVIIMSKGNVVFDGDFGGLVDIGAKGEPRAGEREAEAALRILRSYAD